MGVPRVWSAQGIRLDNKWRILDARFLRFYCSYTVIFQKKPKMGKKRHFGALLLPHLSSKRIPWGLSPNNFMDIGGAVIRKKVLQWVTPPPLNLSISRHIQLMADVLSDFTLFGLLFGHCCIRFDFP